MPSFERARQQALRTHGHYTPHRLKRQSAKASCFIELPSKTCTAGSGTPAYRCSKSVDAFEELAGSSGSPARFGRLPDANPPESGLTYRQQFRRQRRRPQTAAATEAQTVAKSELGPVKLPTTAAQIEKVPCVTWARYGPDRNSKVRKPVVFFGVFILNEASGTGRTPQPCRWRRIENMAASHAI